MDGQEIRTDIHMALKINCNHFLDPLTFHLATSSGQKLNLSATLSQLFFVFGPNYKLPPKESTTSCSTTDDWYESRAAQTLSLGGPILILNG